MFGHNPQVTSINTLNDNAKLKQQLDDVLSRKPTTELEKVLMTENLALKSEVEQLKWQLENEKKAKAEQLLWARLNALDSAAAMFKKTY